MQLVMLLGFLAASGLMTPVSAATLRRITPAEPPLVAVVNSTAANSTAANAMTLTDSNLAIAARWLQGDNPKYYECAAVINQAWQLEAAHSCSADLHHAAALMKEKLPVCKELRQGEEYVVSYGELMRSIDRWCSGPSCDKACGSGEVCHREKSFPFEPSCTKCSKDAYAGPACTAHDTNCGPPPCDQFKDTFQTKLVAQPVEQPMVAVVNSTGAGASTGDLALERLATSNLDLAGQWMSMKLSAFKSKDRPEYYECGSVINQAWEMEGSQPCGAEMHRAAALMKAKVPKCKKLRQGEAFVVSYGELLRAIDTWCNGPNCDKACGGGKVCHREGQFPFEAGCTTCSKDAHLGAACTGPDANCGPPPCDRFADTYSTNPNSARR